jgi:1-deoxy-D-xylulose-5-phosphate reductoisomerase
MEKIKVAVLGSTGSIGTQTLDVIEKYKEHFEVVLLSARRSSQKLLGQVKKFRPKFVVTEDVPTDKWINELPEGTKHLSGKIGLTYAIVQCGALCKKR